MIEYAVYLLSSEISGMKITHETQDFSNYIAVY